MNTFTDQLTKKGKHNVILVDCKAEEVRTFADGINEGYADDCFEIMSSISNGSHKGFTNIKRYLAYFGYPFTVFKKRKEYDCILGWQQFYAINFAFFCKLFRVKKQNKVVAVNFTYKRKAGLIGRIYEKYMSFCCNSKYIDGFHVLSNSYVDYCYNELGIDKKKFIVTTFGIEDSYKKCANEKAEMENFTLTIGRSNRDFNFLVSIWSQQCMKDETLVVISDTWIPGKPLPSNIIHRNDITGNKQYGWFNNCKLCVTAINDGRICSGDTVLLTGMMMAKPIVITSPSTLSEMYVKDGENGIFIPKKIEEATAIIHNLLRNEEQLKELGSKARKSFVTNFSRQSMGKKFACSMHRLRIKD